MPTLEELFRNKKYDRLEGKTPQEAFAVRNSKDIKISTISPLLNATSVPLINRIRLGRNAERFRETRIESELIGLLPFTNFSEPVLYGTDIIRIISQQTSLGEAMKAGTGGRGLAATAARVAGDTVGEAVQFAGSRLLKVPSTFNPKTAAIRAGASIKNTLGSLFPDVLIPSKLYASPLFRNSIPGIGEEYRVHERLATLKNVSAGTKVASFLAKNATGTPDQIKNAVIGQGITIAQQETRKLVSKGLVNLLSRGGDKAQQMAKELQQSQTPSIRWSSLKKYSDVVKGERQFGKPPLNFGNEPKPDTPIDDIKERFDLSTVYDTQFTGNVELYKKNSKLKFLKEKNQNKSEYLDGNNNGAWLYSTIKREKTRDGMGVPINKASHNKDIINSLPPSIVDTTQAGTTAAENNERADMIPLKFISVSNSTQVQFRGTITGLSEQFSPSWESSKFIGSPFNLYTYQSIERTVQFSFRIFSLSKDEHKINWSKISYLASLCYPQEYKGAAGAITAPFLKFTMGDLYRNRECFIENMSYNIDDNFPWEIGLNGKDLQKYRLPKIVEVTITLKFIEAKTNTHNYVPNTTTNKVEPTLLGGKLYSYSTTAAAETDLQNKKIGLNSTNKADVPLGDRAKPSSEQNQQETGDPYPQDSTKEALAKQNELKLRKTNQKPIPNGQTKGREIYIQRKTGKYYYGDGTPYTGFDEKAAGPPVDNTFKP